MSVTILQGDCRDVLPTLDAGSVQMCVTSPPYFGLRSYLDADHTDKAREIGTEQTPTAYVEHMVAVFREVWRVLRDDGTLWLNIGDSYVNNPSTSDIPRAEQGNGSGIFKVPPQKHFDARRQRANAAQPMIDAGLKKKDLIGIPWMLAFALRADGWYLRSDIIWHKPNVMPESVTDRPTKAHEYLFLLTKQPTYYYDADAIREPNTPDMLRRASLGHTRGANGKLDHSRNDAASLRGEHTKNLSTSGRNKRSVWTVATSPYPGAHFATFPEALVEPCILAGSRAGDIVLDPFFGSGTTGRVALKHGRDCIGIELNPAYIEQAACRTDGVQTMMDVAV